MDQALIPAQCLRDGLTVDAEMLGDLVEAQPERAKSFDVKSDPLVDRWLRLGSNVP